MGFTQRVINAGNNGRIAFQLADDGAGVDVIHTRHAHPFGNHAKRHAVIFLARVGAVAGAMQMQNHVVLAAPFRHGLYRRVADHEIDHDDVGTQVTGELGALVHVFHGRGGDVQVMALHFAGFRAGFVHRFHDEQKSVAPMHKRLRVNVLVVLHEIQAAFQCFIHYAAIIFAGQTQLRFGRRAQQRPAEFIEPLAFHHDAGGRALEGFQISHGDAHVF